MHIISYRVCGVTFVEVMTKDSKIFKRNFFSFFFFFKHYKDFISLEKIFSSAFVL